jgi:CRP-like cAMP-binding protein
MDDNLKKLLENEAGGVKLSDELFERIVGTTTEIDLKDKEVLIPYGKVDPNLYVQKDGMLRAFYLDNGTEKTYGFSSPGTIVISYHSMFSREPSVFQIESCGETTLLKMTKKQVDELLDSSLEFAKWLLMTQLHQLYDNEWKTTAVIGSAKDRYLWIFKNRPEYIKRVSSRVMASYLGIAQEHLYRLKKTIK